jgi:hypothetical protein
MHSVLVFPRDEKAAYITESISDAKKKWFGSFYEGMRIEGKVPPLLATTSDDFGSVFHDAVNSRLLEFIISQRFLDVLLSLGMTNLQTFPIVITDYDTRKKYDYWICNVIGTLPCLDRERAEFSTRRSNPSEIMILRRLALDEMVIERHNRKLKPEEQLKLFRLAERPRYLLADESVERAVTAAGITGVEFRKPEDAGDFK